MKTAKKQRGYPSTLKSFTNVGDEPLGKTIGVRFPQSWYAELEEIENIPEFIRGLVREALDRRRNEQG